MTEASDVQQRYRLSEEYALFLEGQRDDLQQQLAAAQAEVDRLQRLNAYLLSPDGEELAEIADLQQQLAAAQGRIAVLEQAIETVLADGESQHPGGWGPDITMVAVLREALKSSQAVNKENEDD